MSISDKLDKLKKRSATLNQKTDQLDATIQGIESALRGTNIEFWWTRGRRLGEVPHRIAGTETTPDRLARRYFHLGYAKLGDDWVLAVQPWEGVQVDHGGDAWDGYPTTAPVSLKRAPRGVKIAAAECIEEFLDALHAEFGRMETMVDKASTLVAPREARDPRDQIATPRKPPSKR